MNGMLVVILGLIWPHVSLSARAAMVLFWSSVCSGYANWAGLFLAAVFGTSRTTPLLGAGHVGTAWQEALVAVCLIGGAGGVLGACGLALVGLGASRR